MATQLHKGSRNYLGFYIKINKYRFDLKNDK